MFLSPQNKTKQGTKPHIPSMEIRLRSLFSASASSGIPLQDKPQEPEFLSTPPGLCHRIPPFNLLRLYYTIACQVGVLGILLL